MEAADIGVKPTELFYDVYGYAKPECQFFPCDDMLRHSNICHLTPDRVE